jgi:hypothetical protein
MSDGLSAWNIGKLAAKLGDAATITFGQSTGEVVGWQFGLNIGGKTDFISDPALVFVGGAKLGSLLKAAAPLWSLVFGRNEFLASSKFGFILGPEAKVNWHGDYKLDLGDFKKPVEVFIKVANIIHILGVLAGPPMANKGVQDNWGQAIGDWTKNNAMALIIAAIIVVFLALMIALILWAVKAQAEIVADAVRAQNAPVMKSEAEILREIAEVFVDVD